MKILKYALTLLLIFQMVSCYKDKGNYNYRPVEVITISGINDMYEVKTHKDTLKITPTVTSSRQDADLEFFWGIYTTTLSEEVRVVDTISRSLSLNYFVVQPAKKWVLQFGVKNKKTGYQQIVSSTIDVGTDFTRGWYVLKDNGTTSDLDLFLTPNTIIPESQMNNLYSLVNGAPLRGKALSINFDAKYKALNDSGVITNTRVMYIVSEKDASVVDIPSLKAIHDFKGLFFSTPEKSNPTLFAPLTLDGLFFENDGKLYSIYSAAANIGLFGESQMRDIYNSDYSLSKYYFAYNFGGYPIFYDELSNSFVAASGSSSILNKVANNTKSDMSANNTNKKVLYMGLKSLSPYSGLALLQDNTNPALKILSTISPNRLNLKIVNDTLNPNSKLYNATLLATNVANENLIYFVVNSKEVWSYNLVNKLEQLQYTVPGNETISYIRHKQFSNEAAYKYNYIVVGSSDGTNYTVRMFNKSSGNLDATPSIVLNGVGSAVGDVFYLSPKLSNYSYYPTY